MLVNANPGLRVNPNVNFFCIKVFFAVYIFLCSLRLFKFNTEGQTIQAENVTEKKPKFSLTLG